MRRLFGRRRRALQLLLSPDRLGTTDVAKELTQSVLRARKVSRSGPSGCFRPGAIIRACFLSRLAVAECVERRPGSGRALAPVACARLRCKLAADEGRTADLDRARADLEWPVP